MRLQFCFLILASFIASHLNANQPIVSAIEAQSAGRLASGERVAAIVPEGWNGKLFLWVAPEPYADEAALLADLRTREPFASLGAYGWMLAAIARPEAESPEIAMSAVCLLQDSMVEAYGVPLRTVLLGESGAGDTVLSMAERMPARVSGAVVAGSGFLEGAPQPSTDLTFEPAATVLMVANRDRIDDAATYVARAASKGIEVALWQVERDGPLSISDEEYIASVLAIDSWLDASVTGYAQLSR
ncbi:MAG: hypothetical protein ACOCVG_00855 [Verrucomicrobiota bacterium]